MRLVDVLRAMPPARLTALLKRHRVAIDEAKRLDPIEQAARALAMPPTLAAFSEWPGEARAAAYRLAAHPDGLPREELGGGALRLVESGIAFHVDGDRVVMPSAYRAQVPPSPADSPRAMRLLLPQLPEEHLHAIASQVLGRTGALPRALVIGDLLDAIEPRTRIETEVASLAPAERTLLNAIEARGAELETSELLELSREPARYAIAGGEVLPRRSTAFSLVRRGLLMATGADLYGLPCEVEEVAGRDRRAIQASARAELSRRATEEDHTPPRAQLATDPGPQVIAMLCALRAEGVALGGAGGAPRSALRKVAISAGVALETAEMLVSLARGEGLHASSVPLGGAGRALFDAWLRGGAWDEARTPEDRHRAHERLSRISTPTVSLRNAVVDVLASLPPQRFAVVADIVRAALSDLRTSSAERGLLRARARDKIAFVRDVPEVIARILDESLVALGAVDRGVEEGVPVIRLAARAHRFLREPAELHSEPGQSTWLDDGRLAVAKGERTLDIVTLGLAADAAPSDDGLVLVFSERTLERSIRAGETTDRLIARVTRLAGRSSEGIAEQLEELSRARVPCRWVDASAFLYVGDELVRAALLAADAESLFISDSPPGGLLVHPDASPAKVKRALLRHGAELRAEPLPPPENIHDSKG